MCISLCAAQIELIYTSGCVGGIEPFDEGLDRHIWSLSDQRLQWDGEIARKRRDKPRDVHRLMKELLETQQAVDEMEKEEYDAIELIEGEEEPDRTFLFFRVIFRVRD